jgi:hypothetical protein
MGGWVAMVFFKLTVFEMKSRQKMPLIIINNLLIILGKKYYLAQIATKLRT